MIIYVHTYDNGHGWLGAVQLQREDGKIVIKEHEYKGWVSTGPFGLGPGAITDHGGEDTRYEIARFFKLTQAQYDKLKEQMNEDQFNGNGYKVDGSNCVNWVEKVFDKVKVEPSFQTPIAGLTIDNKSEIFSNSVELAEQNRTTDGRSAIKLYQILIEQLKTNPKYGHIPPEVKAELGIK